MVFLGIYFFGAFITLALLCILLETTKYNEYILDLILYCNTKYNIKTLLCMDLSSVVLTYFSMISIFSWLAIPFVIYILKNKDNFYKKFEK